MQPSKQESNISAAWSCGRVASSKGSTLSHQIPPSFPKILKHFKGLTQWVVFPRLGAAGVPIFTLLFASVNSSYIFKLNRRNLE